MTYIDTLGQQAKVAGRQIAKLSTAAILSLKMLRIWPMPRKMVFQRLCKTACS